MYCENGNRNTSFELIQKQFFSGISLKYFNWNELFTSVNINDLECQKNLLNLTVLHPLVEKYPLKAAYMQSFLKDIISKFEDSGREVSDEVYETYCKLLSSTDVGDMHYRHYFLGSSTDACITLRESSSLVSQGTTGLCSWQASQALANWCLSHNNLLRGKRVLELGSGVGLTGLAVSLCCKPRSYWFSDCHPAVLELLQSNVQLNLAKQQEQNLAHEFKVDQVLLQASLKDTDIGVVKLPWEQVPHSNIGQQIAPDVVLAADLSEFLVIYSPEGTAGTYSSVEEVAMYWDVNSSYIRNIENNKTNVECDSRRIEWATEKENIENNCENRWRVLDRNYKQYIDSKNSTGSGKKCFEYAEDMDKL